MCQIQLPNKTCQIQFVIQFFKMSLGNLRVLIWLVTIHRDELFKLIIEIFRRIQIKDYEGKNQEPGFSFFIDQCLWNKE